MTDQLTFELTERFTCCGCLDQHPVKNKQIAIDEREYCPFCCDIVNEEYGTTKKPRSLATKRVREGTSTTILRKSIPRNKISKQTGVKKR